MGGYRYILPHCMEQKSYTDIVLLTSAFLRDICRAPNHRETTVFPEVVVDSEALVALVLPAACTIEHISEDRAVLTLVPSVVAEWAPLDICGERYDIVIHVLVNLQRVIDKELGSPGAEDIPGSHLVFPNTDTRRR